MKNRFDSLKKAGYLFENGAAMSASDPFPDSITLLEFWTGLSSLFAEAFPVERHHGLQWFFIDILVHELDNRLTVRDYKDIVSDLKLIDNANYYVPEFLKDLRQIGLVQIETADGKPVNEKILEDEHFVTFPDGFKAAIQSYVLSVYKKAHRDVDGPLEPARARRSMQGIYDYFLFDYVPIWRKLLRQIAREAAASGATSSARLEGRLRDDSAVFVLLHSFWGNYVKNSNRPVSYKNAVHFGAKVRPWDDRDIDDRLGRLEEARIIVREGKGKRATYIFNPQLEQLMQNYERILRSMTAAFLKMLDDQISGQSSLRKVSVTA